MTIISINQDSADQRIDVSVGDSIVVTLPENPTTGFRWILNTDLSPVAELRSDAFDQGGREMFGAPGSRRFTFVVAQAGEANLGLENRQEWEPDASAAKTFSITVVARA